MTKLTEDQISAAIDGEADDSVREIIASDPATAAFVEEARKFENTLRQKLYRWDCPGTQELANYHQGLLSVFEASVIEEHVRHCSKCQQDLAELQDFLAADLDDDSSLELEHKLSIDMRFRRSEELLIQPHLSSEMALVEMRGEDDNKRSFQVNAIGLTLFLEAEPEDEEWEITGAIVADDVEEQPGLKHIIVEFWQDNRLIAAIFTDEDGNFETKIALEAEQPFILRAIIRPDYVIKLNDILLS